MPPKRSDLHHITFHFYRSAVLLSLPASTTLSSIKSQLITALQPLFTTLPLPIPQSPDGLRLYEDRTSLEGEAAQSGLRCIEDDDKNVMGRSIAALGWTRWKTIFVSFRNDDGRFGEPVYTMPDLEDEEPNGKDE